ncbi:MAG TPA: hypothetical protein VKX46_15845, partial [Ktedonobacteraceae bacterium]|nr:hypothetical protein [Ktedonobacteraceae bacterium]
LTLPLTCARPQSATPTTTGTPTATDSATAAATPTDVATPTTTGAQDTLIVNVTFPDNGAVGDTVDIAISVPRKTLQDELFTRQLNIEAPLGKVSVDGLSGILNIKGGSDVAVKNVVLAPASRLETAQGTVHFSGYLDVPPDATQDTHYIIQGEHGIDVTLLSSANVVLDANTNEGTGVITNEFDSTASKTNHPVNYYGPLDPSSSSKPVAILTLDVGSGNITIHKAS